jgi:hypothetical protein
VALGINGTTEYKFSIRYDGADLRFYQDDVEIAGLALVDYAATFPAGFVGNQFVGVWAGNPTAATLPKYDDFKVLDIP